MNILLRIINAIFGQPIPHAGVDAVAFLTEKARGRNERLDWRNSIVDLMKLLDMDSSLEARQELAQELGYRGALDGSAEMNLWLHREVMKLITQGEFS